jgi:hypothetical protein
VLFDLVILAHQRRRVVRDNITDHPTARWTAQQVVEAFPWDEAPRYLLRDRGCIYGAAIRQRVRHMGIEEVPIAPYSPRQNPYVERLIGSIRRECLDQVLVLHARHLRRLLTEYFQYYHHWRTHRALDVDCPVARSVQRPEVGLISEVPELGGLHHHDERRAAWLGRIATRYVADVMSFQDRQGMDRLGRHPQPATVNRELACLRSMFNVARKGLVHLPGGVPTENPVSRVKFLDEHNIRDRVLTAEEFQRMLDASPEYLKPILHCAYRTGMRRTGVDALTAMKITAQKTVAVYKRYNTIDEQDLKAAQRRLDTYMDTMGVIDQPSRLQVPEK